MKGLLKKDWLHIRTSFIAMLPYFLFMIVMSAVSSYSRGKIAFIAVPGMAMFQSILPVVLMMDDVRTGYIRTAMTLPVSRKEMVTEKYLLTLINSAVSGALFAAVTCAAALLGNNSAAQPLAGGILIAASCAISAAIILPVVYLVSTEKIKLIFILAYVIFGGLYGAAGGVAAAFGYDLENMVISVGTSAVILAAALLLAAVSCMISQRLFKKRDI